METLLRKSLADLSPGLYICLFLKLTRKRSGVPFRHGSWNWACFFLSTCLSGVSMQVSLEQNSLLLQRKKGESGGSLGNPDPVFVFDLKFKTLSTGFLLR